jgi:aminocarboxymuconate-semialdehyde decarboxylase
MDTMELNELAAIPTLHWCQPAELPVPRGTSVARSPCRTIDVHCHLHTPAVEQLVAGHPLKLAEQAAARASLGEESSRLNGELLSQLTLPLTSVQQRLADMDAMGVDIQAISPFPLQYYYWAEEDLAEKIVELQNDAIAAVCKAQPGRFLALGTVALQYPQRAARQLEELARDRGFKGVQVSTLINGCDLADRQFDPFWAKADELGVVVFIHSWGSTLGTRLADHYLMNTIGQPFEQTVCLSKLIFNGTFDRCQRLRIIAAHGGGYLPVYAFRSDHAHAVRADAASCRCRPSDYLRRIWFDSVVYGSEHLTRLITAVGRDRVVIGTDYPYDMGHYDPHSLTRSLDEESRRLVLGANAASLFGLRTVQSTDP